jgi:protein TonB
MRNPLFGGLARFDSKETSWLERVLENGAQVLARSRFSATSANGAPLHLLKVDKSSRYGRAQSASLATHAAVISILVLLAMHTGKTMQKQIAPDSHIFPTLRIPPHLFSAQPGANPSEGAGSGGGQNPILATTGDLPPRSAIQIVRPILPDQQPHDLPIPPTILDNSAPPVLTPVDKMGLPWMKEPTNSPGPGKGSTIGNVGGSNVGDSGLGPAGNGGAANTFYAPGTTMPVCVYCPDPRYSDEAREAKLQGTVTLQVLVGADGRAADVRLVKGLGMGLDDRAAQMVRTWHFTPAHDASRHPVARWITIEAVYRLF